MLKDKSVSAMMRVSDDLDRNSGYYSFVPSEILPIDMDRQSLIKAVERKNQLNKNRDILASMYTDGNYNADQRGMIASMGKQAAHYIVRLEEEIVSVTKYLDSLDGMWQSIIEG